MFAFKWFSGLRQFDNTFPIRFYAKLYPLVVTILDFQSTKTKHMYFIKDHLEIGHEARLPRMCIVSDMIHIPMGSLFNNSLLWLPWNSDRDKACTFCRQPPKYHFKWFICFREEIMSNGGGHFKFLMHMKNKPCNILTIHRSLGVQFGFSHVCSSQNMLFNI